MIRALLALLIAANASGNVVTSTVEPRVSIAVPDRFSYVGTDNWVLYGISNCQQFLYSIDGERGLALRVYWIQFESYLPKYPKMHHLYTSKRYVVIGGVRFLVDTWIEHHNRKNADSDTADLVAYMKTLGYAAPSGINTGSDEQHVTALLKAKGQTWPDVTASVRLVHLADATQRRELMIIYTRAIDPGESLKAIDARLTMEAAAGLTVTRK